MMQPIPQSWDPNQDEDLVCVAVRPETHDVSSFVFAAAEPRLFHFLPGQFMTFDLAGARVQRCYTIASPPTRPWRIEITAKRSGLGVGSTWLHETMRPGARIRASGPMGDFTCGPQPAGKYLFLAAGSGITPMMSMARTAHDLGSDADLLFVQSARTAADLIFAAELVAMGARPGFRSVSVVEGDTPMAPWDGFRGRMSPGMLALLAPDLQEREVFCCGPAPYMSAVQAMLAAAGLPMHRYHQESFDFGAESPLSPTLDPPPEAIIPPPQVTRPAPSAATRTPPEDAPTEGAASGAGFSVTFARSGRSIVCPPGSTVLAAARIAGIQLPSACAKGVCGTCKSRLVSGTVDMRHGGGIRQREIDAGMALLCCARPTSDLVVER